MKHVLNTIIFAAFIFATANSTSAQTQEEKARNLMKKYTPTLVVLTVKGKIVTTTDGDPLPVRERQRRTLGITIADNGLIAVSNSAIDLSVGLAGQKSRIGNKVVTIKTAKTEFTDIEISYGDSVVIHGKVVRQVVEADIAFVLPDPVETRAKNKKFKKVDLSQYGTAKSADQVVGLSRSSSVFGYMPTLTMGRISGVFKDSQTSRTYFLNTASNSQGVPVFSLDGRPIGITVVRIVNGRPTGILATLSAGSILVMAKLVEGY